MFQSNSSKQLIGGLLKKYDEKIDKAYEASNADDFHDLEENALEVLLDKFQRKDINLKKMLYNESVVGYRCFDCKYISGPYSELIGVTLVWRNQLYTLRKTSMPSTSTSKSTLTKTVHDSADINSNPTKKDKEILHIVSGPSSRFSSEHIAEAFNDKDSINDFVKNYVKYELGYTDCNEKVLKKFIEELKQANKTYDLSKCTQKELKEYFEKFYNSVNNTAMKTTSEMLVKEYYIKDFLKDFAKENYYIEKDNTFFSLDANPRTVRMYDPTTAQNNALNDLVSSIKLEYTRKTGKDCEYSDEDIKNVINLKLQQRSGNKLKVSAYDIINKAVYTLSSKHYSSEAIEHLSDIEIRKYFMPSVTENGVVKQYVLKEGVSATEVEDLINNKPVGNNIKLKRMISSNSTDEIVQFIKDLLNNKISAQTDLKGDEDIKVGHIINGNVFGDKVIETFVNNVLMKYCEAYNTNEFSVNMILDGLKSYLASMQKMDMKTGTEGLVKEYKADEFLTAFAKDNYGNTNADNVMSQLLLNVKKVYIATTGNNCKYSDDQIKKLINTMLQSNSNSNISAYTIIDNAVSMLQQIDKSAKELDSIDKTKALEDAKNDLQHVKTLYVKANEYLSAQIKGGKTISINEFVSSVKNELGSEYTEQELASMLIASLVSLFTDAGLDKEKIVQYGIELANNGKIELFNQKNNTATNPRAVKMRAASNSNDDKSLIMQYFDGLTSMPNLHSSLNPKEEESWGAFIAELGDCTTAKGGTLTAISLGCDATVYGISVGEAITIFQAGCAETANILNLCYGNYGPLDEWNTWAEFGIDTFCAAVSLIPCVKPVKEWLGKAMKGLNWGTKTLVNAELELSLWSMPSIARAMYNKNKITPPSQNSGSGDIPQGRNNTRPSGGGTSAGGSNSSSTTTGSSNNNHSGKTQGSGSGKTQGNGSNKNDSNTDNNNSQNPDLRDIFGEKDYNDRFGGNPSSSSDDDDSLNDDFDMTDFGLNGDMNKIFGWQSDSKIDHSNDSHGTIGNRNPEHYSEGSLPTNSWTYGCWKAIDRDGDGKADAWGMKTKDKNGNTVTYVQTDTNGDGVADTEHRFYKDTNGATVKESTERLDDGSTVTSRVYTDKEGNVTRSVDETKDANGHVTSVKTRNEDGSTHSAEVSRDLVGNFVLKQTQTDANGDITEEIIYRYDAAGFDENGFNIYGFDKDGYGRDGFNSFGFNREGYDRDGFNIYGYDKDGYYRDGNNIDGSYDYNHNTNLTDAQKDTINNYFNGYYNDPNGNFDSGRFYDDMISAGFNSGDIGTYDGFTIDKIMYRLRQGASVDDILSKYGSGNQTHDDGVGDGDKDHDLKDLSVDGYYSKITFEFHEENQTRIDNITEALRNELNNDFARRGGNATRTTYHF